MIEVFWYYYDNLKWLFFFSDVVFGLVLCIMSFCCLEVVFVSYLLYFFFLIIFCWGMVVLVENYLFLLRYKEKGGKKYGKIEGNFFRK